MDYYSFNPNIADLLASPIIRRKNAELGRRVPDIKCFEHFAQDNVHFENISTNKYRFSSYTPYYERCQQATSTNSLILRKTVQVETQYSEQDTEDILKPRRPNDLPTQHQQHNSSNKRPVIRVTIVPTHSKQRKRRRKGYKYQNTVSNHDNSIKSQNVYLVVPENKKNQGFGAKTTESNHSNNSLQQLKNDSFLLEHHILSLLENLEMDKKKKKGKKDKGKKDDDEDFPSKTSLLNVLESSGSPKLSLLKECMCTPSSPSPDEHVSGRKSRVRITGKIGLTEDDRYVLKCNATIDGKPVETSFSNDNLQEKWGKLKEGIQAHFDENKHQRESFRKSLSPPGSPNERNWGGNATKCPAFAGPPLNKCPAPGAPCERKKEPIMACYDPNANKCPAPGAPCERKRERNLFQREAYAQANITIERVQKVPCPVFASPSPCLKSVETQSEPHAINAVCFNNIEKLQIVSQNKDEMVQCNCLPESPTVLGGDYINDAVANKSCSSPLVIISVYPKHTNSSEKVFEEKISPKDSPMRLDQKKGGNKKGGGKKKEGAGKEGKGARSRSPTPPKAGAKGKAEKDQKGKKGGADDKNAKGKKGGKKDKGGKLKEKIISPSFSPDRQSLRSGQKSPIRGEAGVCTECCVGCPGRSKARFDEPSQTMDIYDEPRTQTKRMMNWVSAKREVSNVAISIDGEKEFYDVLFRQGDNTTDLRVRKTVKDEIENTVDNLTDSLENFYVPDTHKHRKRSFSQTYLFENPPNADTDLQTLPMMSTLHVRDSIEISHRREERDSSVRSLIVCPTSDSSSSSDDKIRFAISAPAPIRHYPGDSCNLPNPVERDREIRELLGIERRGSRSSQMPSMQIPAEDSLTCLKWNNACKKVADTITPRNLEPLLSMENDLNKPVICDDLPHDGFTDYCFWEKAVPSREVVNRKIPIDVMFNYSTSHMEDKTDSTNEDNSNFKILFTKNKTPGDLNVGDAMAGVSYQKSVVYNKGCQAFDDQMKHTGNKKQQRPNATGQDYQNVLPFAEFKAFRQPQNMFKEKIQQDTSKLTQNQHSSLECKDSDLPFSRHIFFQRDINVYLQLNENKDKKPIVLSRPQLARVKRTIDKAITKKTSVYKRSNISIGEVRMKPSKKKFRFVDKSTQCETLQTKTEETDKNLIKKHKYQYEYAPESRKTEAEKDMTQQTINTNYGFNKHEEKNNVPKHLYKNALNNTPRKEGERKDKEFEYAKLLSKEEEKRVTNVLNHDKHEYEKRIKREEQMHKNMLKSSGRKAVQMPELKVHKNSIRHSNVARKRDSLTHCRKCGTMTNQHSKLCRQCQEIGRNSTPDVSDKIVMVSRHAASSTEFRCTAVSYKRMAFPAAVENRRPDGLSVAEILLKNYDTNSLHTIFNGLADNRESAKEFGTSENSLYSEYIDASSESKEDINDLRQRKPFLRRLMSFLVMRSKTSDIKINKGLPQGLLSHSNTTDSYHINTSLEGIELTSSIYDTSASFYSNHSIHPINSKMKRGFLSSVRGFLTNRRHN